MTAEKHRLCLLGAFTASAPLSRKARAILAYLSFAPDTQVARERLAVLLWSERGEEQARASLRQCLQELRPFSSGPLPLLDIGRTHVTLCGTRVVTDLDEIQAMARAGDAGGLALRLAREPNRLLENLDGLDAEFDTWLQVQRQASANEIRVEAMACAEANLAAKPTECLRLAQVILAREPLDESAARLAMRAAHAAREPGEARRIWRRLNETLKSELGVAPSDETRACHAELTAAPPPTVALAQEAAARAHSAAPALSPRRRLPWAAAIVGLTALAVATSLAVFSRPPSSPRTVRVDRLRSPAGDAAATLFADGFAGDLARMVETRRSGLNVSDHATAGGRPRFIIDGVARSVAGRLAVTTMLHAADGGAILWSAEFDQPQGDVQALRVRAAARVAEALTCAVGQDDRARDIEITRTYLAACDKLHDSPPDPGAATVLQGIVARDPGFARAWGDLALIGAVLASDSEAPPEETFSWGRMAEAAAARALALDPKNSNAWTARASLAIGLNRWAVRRAALDRALALDPGNARALAVGSDAMASIGRMNEAVRLQARAADLDPLSLPIREDLAQKQAFEVGAAGDSMTTFQDAERQWPDSRLLRSYPLQVLMRMGDPRTAREALAEYVRQTPADDRGMDYWRRLVAARADPSRAREAAKWFMAHANWGPIFAIEGLTEVGRPDLALDVAFAHPESLDTGSDILFRPFMAPLRASPRFMQLARRLGLVEIWRTNSLWPDFCTAPDAPYDCKARAAAATGG